MIDIVIPTYTNSTGLRKCLESIVQFTDLSSASITVVANGAPEETRQICSEFPVNLLWFDAPLGFSKACNEGLKISTADRVVLLNDDCILLGQEKNKWVEILSEPFVDPKVGITGVLKNYCPHAQREFLLFFCVMIRREVIKDIGLLDEAFGVGAGEDADYCIRAEDAGWLIKQSPETPPYVVDKNDLSLPEYQRHMWIADFPLFHQAGCTVGKIEGFDKVFARNSEILRERYGVNIERAKQTEGWMADTELEWLARQAKKAHTWIEVGAWCGRSTRAVADNLPADAVMYVVDSFNGSSGEPDAHKTAKEREGDGVYMKFCANLYDHIRLGRVVPLRMQSANAAEWLAKQGVQADVIFLDGDHSTEGVRTDIESFKPLVKEGGLLCGHDYYLPEQNPEAWIGVRTVVNEMFPEVKQAPNTSIWNVRLAGQPKRLTVTAEISTLNRYETTLPLAISAILNQTHLPDKLIIYDDGEQKDLRELSPFDGLLRLADDKGVKWVLMTTPKQGQVTNHQHCLDTATTDTIWRVDDDEVPEPDCLEKLLREMGEGVGAVAGLVHHPGAVSSLPPHVDGSLNDISLGLNMQWFDLNGSGPREVSHLYSTFLFRTQAGREAGGYPINLSVCGHREESIFSHSLSRAGWKLIVTPYAKTHHLRASTGGIRSYTDQSLWEHDEQVWQEYLKTWGVVQQDSEILLADFGLGDTLILKGIWSEIRRRHPNRKYILALAHAAPFEDVDDVTIISIAQAKLIIGSEYENKSLYAWAWKNNKHGNIVDLMREFFGATAK